MAAFKEGLYRLGFHTLTGWGYGLAYLANGKIYGGDSYIYYIGTYSISGNYVQARVKAKPYIDNPPPGAFSLFGREDNTVEIEGDLVEGSRIELKARSKQAPGIELKAVLEHLSD